MCLYKLKYPWDRALASDLSIRNAKYLEIITIILSYTYVFDEVLANVDLRLCG